MVFTEAQPGLQHPCLHSTDAQEGGSERPVQSRWFPAPHSLPTSQQDPQQPLWPLCPRPLTPSPRPGGTSQNEKADGPPLKSLLSAALRSRVKVTLPITTKPPHQLTQTPTQQATHVPSPGAPGTCSGPRAADRHARQSVSPRAFAHALTSAHTISPPPLPHLLSPGCHGPSSERPTLSPAV